MNEIWKKIPGNPGYEASSLGRIRSVERKIKQKSCLGKSFAKSMPGAVLSPNVNRNRGGYHSVSLGRGTKVKVHRLVWSAFNGEIPAGFVINHKDFNKENNGASNLEAVSPAENSRHAAAGNRGRRTNQHLSDLDIAVIRKSVRSRRVLSRLFRTTEATIKLTRQKKIFKHVGDL